MLYDIKGYPCNFFSMLFSIIIKWIVIVFFCLINATFYLCCIDL